MSFNTTQDNIVYDHSINGDYAPIKPFLSKKWSEPIYDKNNSANYNTQYVVFDTTDFKNAMTWQSYAEGIFSFPLVIKVESDGTNWNTPDLKASDFMLGLKNSHTQLINSVSILINDKEIVQNVPNTNMYLTFIQHCNMSYEDELLNGPIHGYAKDSSTSWDFKDTASTMGIGLVNNANFKMIDSGLDNDVFNEGLLKRQKFLNKMTEGKKNVLGADSAGYKKDAKNYISNTAIKEKFYYYTATIRFRDLWPNLFTDFPLTQNVKMKITFNLNINVTFKITVATGGLLSFSDFANPTGETNPIMIAATSTTIETKGTGSSAVGAPHDTLTTNAVSQKIPCGSATLQVEAYTISLRLGKNTSTLDSEGAGAETQCSLTIPSYEVSPVYLQNYLSSKIKRIYYSSVDYTSFDVASTNTGFNMELWTSAVRPQRLIMVPILLASENQAISPLSSPFTTEPATTSPCVIGSFNCLLSSQNIFQKDIDYSFEHFIQSLNGSSGLNANMVTGMVSSRINLVDFQNNYHYICIDLSRSSPDKVDVAKNIRVRGVLKSLKGIRFYCFLERLDWFELDIQTGVIVNSSK